MPGRLARRSARPSKDRLQSMHRRVLHKRHSADGDIIAVDPHLHGLRERLHRRCAVGRDELPVSAGGRSRRAQLAKRCSAPGGAKARRGRNADRAGSNGTDGRLCLDALSGGVPDNVLPLEAWHVASIGLDVLLAAVAAQWRLREAKRLRIARRSPMKSNSLKSSFTRSVTRAAFSLVESAGEPWPVGSR